MYLQSLNVPQLTDKGFFTAAAPISRCFSGTCLTHEFHGMCKGRELVTRLYYVWDDEGAVGPSTIGDRRMNEPKKGASARRRIPCVDEV